MPIMKIQDTGSVKSAVVGLRAYRYDFDSNKAGLTFKFALIAYSDQKQIYQHRWFLPGSFFPEKVSDSDIVTSMAYSLVVSDENGEKRAILPCPPYCGKGYVPLDSHEFHILSSESKHAGTFSISDVKKLKTETNEVNAIFICMLEYEGKGLTKFGLVGGMVEPEFGVVIEVYSGPTHSIVLSEDSP